MAIKKRQLKLGDTVAKIARLLRIPHCEKCERRRRILNEIRTLGMKETIRRLRVVGLSKSNSDNESWSVEEIIKKMEDCCDEK